MGRVDKAKAALEARNMHGGAMLHRYTLAFLENDSIGMQQVVERAMGTDEEGFAVELGALTQQHAARTRAHRASAAGRPAFGLIICCGL